MLRRFTRDIGRYKAEALHDYPKHTWEQIERDARKLDKNIRSLDDFTQLVESNAALSSMLKGRQAARQRLGRA